MDREAGAGRGANRIAVGPETGKLVATGRSVQMATVLALGGAIVYHDGYVRTNHRPRGQRRQRGQRGQQGQQGQQGQRGQTRDAGLKGAGRLLCRRWTTATVRELSARFGLTHPDSASDLIGRGKRSAKSNRDVTRHMASMHQTLAVNPESQV